MKNKSLPHVFVLTRVYCQNIPEREKFIEGLKNTLSTVGENGYKGDVTILIYDDTPQGEKGYDSYVDLRDEMLAENFKGEYVIVPHLKGIDSMGSAYAMHRLREYFLSGRDGISNTDVAITLDQDDELRRGAISQIAKKMKERGVVVSPFRIKDDKGLDITDDGGRIHNILVRLLCCKCLRKFIISGEQRTRLDNYKKLYMPFSWTEVGELMCGIWQNLSIFVTRLRQGFSNFFCPSIGLPDLSSIGWTKSYSYEALNTYHTDLTEFISGGKSSDSSAKIQEFYKDLNAYEDFIDFYLFLLADISVVGILPISHIYKKHPNSITAKPKLNDFKIKRTNSLLTLIDLSYAKYNSDKSKFRKNFKPLLHRFVASKSYQIGSILKKYISDYKEKGMEQYADIAMEVHDNYFVNKLVRLATNENRGLEQDNELLKLVFTRSENTVQNFRDLFSEEVYNNIPQYRTTLTANSPKHILLSSICEESFLRGTLRENDIPSWRKRCSSHRRFQFYVLCFLFVVVIFFTISLLLGLGVVRLLGIHSKSVSAWLGFLGVIVPLLLSEVAKTKTAIEEDNATLKLYYSEFTDLIRHLEANIMVLLEIRLSNNVDSRYISKIRAQSVHFENLKWPENSVLFSDVMAKLMPRDKVDDFTRIKINIRNINNSALWMTNQIKEGVLTSEQLDWELTRCFGYLVNLYYMDTHDFKSATQNELEAYIYDENIMCKLTELFKGYEPKDRSEKVKYYITRYYDDRRMRRSVLR